MHFSNFKMFLNPYCIIFNYIYENCKNNDLDYYNFDTFCIFSFSVKVDIRILLLQKY